VNVDAELEILSPEECLALAASMPIGRIVFTDRALPAVQPVNFLVEDGSVIIRTAQGSKLAAATRNAIVAFEVDEFDHQARTGWSVTLVGRAQSVRDPDEVARLARLPLRTWAPGERDRFIRIRPEHVSGRRIPAEHDGHARPEATSNGSSNAGSNGGSDAGSRGGLG
jgi:nitroimidazol reductase NimA-like FMN-containing flavoprotein (pyridoxamine 5'-phosphate oxidase superfamily)